MEYERVPAALEPRSVLEVAEIDNWSYKCSGESMTSEPLIWYLPVDFRPVLSADSDACQRFSVPGLSTMSDSPTCSPGTMSKLVCD